MKTMKALTTALLLLGLILNVSAQTASLDSEGGGSSGGGGSFICKGVDSETQQEIIYSAVSQDLWEASRKYQIITSLLNEADLSFEVLKKFTDIGAIKFQEDVTRALRRVLRIRSIEPVKLVSLGDSHHLLEKAECSQGTADFTPAALYIEDDLVYSSRVWKKMDNVSQAALNVHEAIYKVLRDDYQDKTSERARKIVGFLFSNQPSSEVINLIPLDMFNGYSSKPYNDKIEELLQIFRLGTTARLNDFNQIQTKCVGLKRDYIYVDQKPLNFNLTVDTKITVDRKGRTTNVGSIYFKEINTPLIGDYRQLVNGGRSGKIYGYSAPGTVTSRDGYPYLSQEKFYHSGSNPQLGLQVSEAYIYDTLMSNEPSSGNVQAYFFKKASNGDMIIAALEATECLNYKPGLLGRKCTKVQTSDDLEGYPHIRISDLYYCPHKID